VTIGAKQGIYNLMQALLNPGDEVLIPAPYWVSYPDMALLADATPVFIGSTIRENFKITPEQLAKAITPKTKLFIINSPSNPSGVAYSKKELAALGEVLLKHPQITILTDDIYEHILWTKEPFVNIVNACPELYNRTIVLNGVSKSYAMTGWRIGFAAGPQKLISAMTNIQSQSTSNPNSIAQVAAEAALKGDQSCIKIMNEAYHRRHDLMYQGLSKIPGIECVRADGTFYSFFSVQGLLEKLPQLKSDIEFAEYLLNNAGVASIPGSPFGAPNCIRLSFAASEAILNDALNRMQKLFN
jgi:aspartate aminotransferase